MFESKDDAETALRAWAANQARRDELVTAARQAGVSKNRIHTLTRIARTTIDRILEDTVTLTDLRNQITRSLTDQAEGIDVDAIAEEIRDRYGIVDIDSIDSDEYWEIVRSHDATQQDALAVGARVTIPEHAIPSDWPTTGEIAEVGDETYVVELDNGRRQELPHDEVTPA